MTMCCTCVVLFYLRFFAPHLRVIAALLEHYPAGAVSLHSVQIQHFLAVRVAVVRRLEHNTDKKGVRKRRSDLFGVVVLLISHNTT